jgi:hypothetical protein
MNEIVKKNGINYGIVLGLISILLTTIIYSINIELFISGWISAIKFIAYTVLFVLLLTKTKKQLNGIFSFKDAFTTFFIAAIIGITLGTLFEILLFNVIDPSLKDSLKELSIKFTTELLEKFDTPTAEINKAIEGIEKSDQFSIGKQFQGLFVYFIFAAVFGLLFAAIFKSKSTTNE